MRLYESLPPLRARWPPISTAPVSPLFAEGLQSILPLSRTFTYSSPIGRNKTSLGESLDLQKPDSTDRRQPGCWGDVCVHYTSGAAAFLYDIVGMKQSERLLHLRQKEPFRGDKRKHKDGDNNIIYFKLYICLEGS